MDFRLVGLPISMTLNDVRAVILRFSPNSIALLAKYVTVVGVPVPVFQLLAVTNPPCSAVSLR